MANFADYRDHVGAHPDKQFKSTLFRSGRLLLGLNCLAPGQEQHLHDHAEQDKFYFVVEGTGRFVVGDEIRVSGEGTAVWAPAGVPHGVRNDTNERLVLLVGIAPFA
jgi:mannose-6-phosphate isomerase-like protein (cupin superfamily)